MGRGMCPGTMAAKNPRITPPKNTCGETPRGELARGVALGRIYSIFNKAAQAVQGSAPLPASRRFVLNFGGRGGLALFPRAG